MKGSIRASLTAFVAMPVLFGTILANQVDDERDIISACPGGWEWKPEFNKCYYLIDDYGMNWYEANEGCMARDPEATLTSVESMEENDYIASLTAPDEWQNWLGGTDAAEEGVWRWVNLCVCELGRDLVG